MRAAVDDVDHGHGQDLGVDAAQIFVEGQAQVFRGHAGAGHAGPQHGVGPQAGFVVRAVQINEGIVNLHLAQHVHAREGVGNFAVDVLHGLGHALAAKAFFVAVAHFQRFAAAGGRAGRHGGSGAVARFQRHFHFHSGVAARIKNLTAENRGDAAHDGSFCPAGGDCEKSARTARGQRSSVSRCS